MATFIKAFLICTFLSGTYLAGTAHANVTPSSAPLFSNPASAFGANLKYLQVQQDSQGRRLLLGFNDSEYFIVRLDAALNLDTTFSEDGYLPVGDRSATVKASLLSFSDSSVLVATADRSLSHQWSIRKFTPNGESDTTFNGGSALALTSHYSLKMARDSADRIIFCAQPTNANSSTAVLVARRTSSGSIDASFGNDGYINTGVTGQFNLCEHLQITADDEIILASGTYEFVNMLFLNITSAYLVHLDAQGQLAPGMPTEGFVLLSRHNEHRMPSAMAIGNDDKLYVGIGNAILRMNLDGVPDPTFGTNGVHVGISGTTVDALVGFAFPGDGTFLTLREGGRMNAYADDSRYLGGTQVAAGTTTAKFEKSSFNVTDMSHALTTSDLRFGVLARPPASLTANRTGFDFRAIPLDEWTSVVMTLRNSGLSPTALTISSTDHPGLEISGCAETLNPGDSCALDVRVTPINAYDVFTSELTISPDSGQTLTYQVRWLADDVTPKPGLSIAELTLNTPVDTRITQQLTIRNNADRAIRVQPVANLSSVSFGPECYRQILAANATCTTDVIFQSGLPMHLSGTVSVIYMPSDRSVNFPIRVSTALGTGVVVVPGTVPTPSTENGANGGGGAPSPHWLTLLALLTLRRSLTAVTSRLEAGAQNVAA